MYPKRDSDLHDGESFPHTYNDHIRRLCAFIAGGKVGPNDLEETFKKLGVTNTHDYSEIIAATTKYIGEQEASGKIPSGGLEWFNEFVSFIHSIRITPFQEILSSYGRFMRNPVSAEAETAVRKIAETQGSQIDPKIQVMINYFDSAKNSAQQSS